MHLTVSPSVMCSYSPRTTAPTESRSRFSARPNVLPGNSSISPCIALDRPWMRQMPSVTETTVPCVRTSAPVSRFWIRARDQLADFGRVQLHDVLVRIGAISCGPRWLSPATGAIAQLHRRPSITVSPTVTRAPPMSAGFDDDASPRSSCRSASRARFVTIRQLGVGQRERGLDRRLGRRLRLRSSARRTSPRSAAAARRGPPSTSTRMKLRASRRSKRSPPIGQQQRLPSPRCRDCGLSSAAATRGSRRSSPRSAASPTTPASALLARARSRTPPRRTDARRWRVRPWRASALKARGGSSRAARHAPPDRPRACRIFAAPATARSAT